MKLFLVSGLASLSLSVAAHAEPVFHAVVFSTPGHGEHISTLESLLRDTPAGETVRACVYQWDDRRLAASFVEAARRGVSVRAMAHPFDDDSYERAHDELSGLDRIEGCSFHRFKSGPGKKNHNKFVLFSRVDRQDRAWPNVVFVTSGNFTEASKERYQNSLVIEDVGLYERFDRYWNDMMRHGEAGTNDLDYFARCVPDDRRTDAGTDPAPPMVYFSPRRKMAGQPSDPVVSAIDDVRMTRDHPQPHFRIAMARWSDGRWLIAERLALLAAAGANVEVVIRKPSGKGGAPVDSAGVAPLLRPEVPVKLWFAPGTLHSKYMLVDGVHGEASSGRKKIVWTGSQNYTEAGLRTNDEALLRIESGVVHDAYVVDFERLKKVSKRFK